MIFRLDNFGEFLEGFRKVHYVETYAAFKVKNLFSSELFDKLPHELQLCTLLANRAIQEDRLTKSYPSTSSL